MGPFVYRDDILKALAHHGVCPRPWSPPEKVHEFVRDVYRFEIRRLRDRLLAGDFPRREYAGRVVALRRRYHVISVRPAEWLKSG
jgi:hypothetical protein